MRLALVAWLAVSIGCMLSSLVLLLLGVRNVFLTVLIGTAAVSVLVWAARFLISSRTLRRYTVTRDGPPPCPLPAASARP